MSGDRSQFTLARYLEMVDSIRDCGFALSFFDLAPARQRALILRHDIDMCPKRALTMASAEESRGITSTYFVMLTSNLYNPFSRDCRVALRELLQLGHEVGLHFDPHAYSHCPSPEKSELDALQECTVLEQLLERPVRVISFHRPLASYMGLDAEFAGRLNAYSKRFTMEMDYCSDSQGRWRFGHPLEIGRQNADRSMQLLIHPVWWVTDQARESEVAKLERFVQDKLIETKTSLAQNCQPYRAVLIAKNGRRSES